MLPGLLLHLILSFGPDVPSFPAAHPPGRGLPDTPPDCSCPGTAYAFSGQFHPMSRLHAYVFVLNLMDLSMDKAVYLMPCGGGGELCRTGTLDGSLGGQLFLGGFQLDSRVFGLGLGPFLLFLLLVLPGLLGVLFLMGGIPAGLVILPQAGGRLFPFLVLPEFPAARWLRANLARGRLPGLTGHFFFGKMEPPTLDPLSGRSVLFVLRANLARSGLTHSAPPFPPGG